MATFEHRTDTRGNVTAIRAKVRRVGAPHLSKSFAVVATGAPGAAAIRRALAGARAWVAEIEAGLGLGRANRGDMLAPSASSADTRPMRQTLRAAWAGAADATVRNPAPAARHRPAFLARNPLPEDQVHRLLLQAPDDRTRSLLAFVLATAQPPQVLARLRWQHVLLAQRCIEVRAGAGHLLRQVPLVPAAVEALLGRGGRKYGLVFGGDALAIHATLQSCMAGLALDVPALYRAAAWRWVQRGLGEDEVAAFMGLVDLSPLGPQTDRQADRQPGRPTRAAPVV